MCTCHKVCRKEKNKHEHNHGMSNGLMCVLLVRQYLRLQQLALHICTVRGDPVRFRSPGTKTTMV
jgi:hypothetical protein